jgi:hypothetical protein
MQTQLPPKRLILRAVLRDVSPMVIRLLSVPDQLELPAFHQTIQTVLGWEDDPSYIVRIQPQEFNGFRRLTRTKKLSDFRLHRQEKFYYASDLMSLWEWDVRVFNIQEGTSSDVPTCLGGRGAAPPEHCGGPTGYRLMLKRQEEGDVVSDPVMLEMGIQLLASAEPEAPASMWDTLRKALQEGGESVDRRLEQYGPLQPNSFSLREAHERLHLLANRRRLWS